MPLMHLLLPAFGVFTSQTSANTARPWIWA